MTGKSSVINNHQFFNLQSPQNLYGQGFIMPGLHPGVMSQQMNIQKLPPAIEQPLVLREKKLLNFVDPNTQCEIDLPSKLYILVIVY